MKTDIQVLQPGLFSSIQDLGRFGFQQYGVPLSGYMDTYAAKIANLIVGNTANHAVMEITFTGPRLKFYRSTEICISGADLSPKINGVAIANHTLYKIFEGDVLEFGVRNNGFRAYLAVSGGFQTELVMKSRSWYEGLTHQFRLDKQSQLSFGSSNEQKKSTHAKLKFEGNYVHLADIEVFKGPEFDLLPKNIKNSLFEDNFSIDKNSNRMAILLEENLNNALPAIITGPVLPGTIQLTPSGKLIILMNDCQTTGGYPRILQLSERGKQTVSQKIPGSRINFILKVHNN